MFLGHPDPFVTGPDPAPDPDPSFSFLTKVLSILKECFQNKILKQNFSKKNKFLKLKIMCLRLSYKKKM